MVGVPCSKKHQTHCSPWHANLVATYREERHRQEVAWEGMTGGYAGDARHLRAMGHTLITFGEWLKAHSHGNSSRVR